MLEDRLSEYDKKFYTYVGRFFRKYGHCQIPYNVVYRGYPMASLIFEKTTLFKVHKMSLEEWHTFVSCGLTTVSAKYLSEVKWLYFYDKAKDYYESNGELLPLDKNISLWLNQQRTFRNQGKLSDDRISMLNQIGMIWDVHYYNWLCGAEALGNWMLEGHELEELRGSGRYKHYYNGYNLGAWVNWNRAILEGIVDRPMTKEQKEILHLLGIEGCLTERRKAA